MFACFNFHTMEPTWDKDRVVNRKCENLAKIHSWRQHHWAAVRKPLPTSASSAFSNKDNFKVGLAWKIASGGEVLAVHWNYKIQLRNYCGDAKRLYIHFNHSSILQRGFESSGGFKMPCGNPQCNWVEVRKGHPKSINVFVFYSIFCEASLPIFLIGTLGEPSAKITPKIN